jgi:hypothetical protein
MLRPADLSLLGAHRQDRSQVLARSKIYFPQPFCVIGEEQSVASNHRINDHVRGALEADGLSVQRSFRLVSWRSQYAGAEEYYPGTYHDYSQGVPHRLT